MKTGMEWPLFGVVVLAIVYGLWSAWQGMQLDMSIAAVNVATAAQLAPAPVAMVGGWIVTAIIGAVISGTVVAGVTAVIVWARGKWIEQNATQNAWRAGPNAKWARGPGQDKPPTEAQMMRMLMMRQMGMEPRRRGTPREFGDDDEPILKF